jgi:hypothetical protein
MSSENPGFFYDSKGRMQLDEFGFPEVAVANRILLHMDRYGESRDDLEKTWEKWVHHIPFDSPVAQALVKLYSLRLDKMDKENNAAEYQRLKRKIDLAQRRAKRYDIRLFTNGNESG